jgi:catechol 2,3-dioxygenase-like lactoylglutathione lyase family enzyme
MSARTASGGNGCLAEPPNPTCTVDKIWTHSQTDHRHNRGAPFNILLRIDTCSNMSASKRSNLGLVAIIVKNYDTAIEWFVKIGFEVHEDSPATTNAGEPKRWVVIKRPNQKLPMETGILLAQADGPEQQAMIGKQFAGRVGMFLYVDDFDAEYARFQEAGVEFVDEPRVNSYGKVVIFRDICGNKWDLIQPADMKSNS